MFEYLKKKKNSPRTSRAKTSEKTCLKCQHTRNAHDLAPKWQCPNCKRAYNKLGSVAGNLKSNLNTTANKFDHTTVSEKLKSLENFSLMLGLSGIVTFANGLPSENCTCNGIIQAAKSGSPLLLLIGSILTISGIVYYVKNRIRIKNEQKQ